MQRSRFCPFGELGRRRLGRPKKFRRVLLQPDATYFKPAGIPLANLEENVINVDEWEAVRLADAEGFGQEKAASKMRISQPTFNRLLSSARSKLANAITKGKAIKIEKSAK